VGKFLKVSFLVISLFLLICEKEICARPIEGAFCTNYCPCGTSPYPSCSCYDCPDYGDDGGGGGGGDDEPVSPCDNVVCEVGHTEVIGTQCYCVEDEVDDGSSDCKYVCDNKCCPAGTYCSTANVCIIYGDDGSYDGDGSTPDYCNEVDTDCDPTDYCASNGFTTTPTDYLLEDVVSCTARINFEDVTRVVDCYEDPSSTPDFPVPWMIHRH